MTPRCDQTRFVGGRWFAPSRRSPRRPAAAPRRCDQLLLAVIACSACATEPLPRIDDALGIEVPAAWSAQAPSTTTSGQPNTDHEAGAPLDAAFWTEFADENLDRLVELALTNNRDLAAALARFEAAVALREITGAPLLPEVDGGLDGQRARRLFLGFPFGSGGVPSTTVTTWQLSLSVRWELDLWGRLRSLDQAALADQQALLHDLAAARLSLAGQVCRAYFTAVEARQQLVLAERTVAAFAATLEDVRDRFRRGVRPALDVHLAATNLANAEAAVAQRREALQRALRQIDVLVGRYPSGIATAASELPSTPATPPAGLPGELLQRRPDLLAAERRVAAAGGRVAAARAALYPRLSLTASGGTTSLDLEDLVDDDFRFWSFGGNLLAPLFRGGALRAEVRQRDALRREAFAGYGDAVLRAFAEVEDVLATDGELRQRRTALARAADHAVRALDLARERWQLGLTDFLAVADGQRQAFQAQSALIAADRLRLENRIDLFLALGGGYEPEPEGATP